MSVIIGILSFVLTSVMICSVLDKIFKDSAVSRYLSIVAEEYCDNCIAVLSFKSNSVADVVNAVRSYMYSQSCDIAEEVNESAEYNRLVYYVPASRYDVIFKYLVHNNFSDDCKVSVNVIRETKYVKKVCKYDTDCYSMCFMFTNK